MYVCPKTNPSIICFKVRNKIPISMGGRICLRNINLWFCARIGPLTFWCTTFFEITVFGLMICSSTNPTKSHIFFVTSLLLKLAFLVFAITTFLKIFRFGLCKFSKKMCFSLKTIGKGS